MFRFGISATEKKPTMGIVPNSDASRTSVATGKAVSTLGITALPLCKVVRRRTGKLPGRAPSAGESSSTQPQAVPGAVALSPGFEAELDRLSKAEWDGMLGNFQDATLYQSWSYPAARWGEKNLSRLVLKQGREVVGGAHIDLVKVPVLGVGLA